MMKSVAAEGDDAQSIRRVISAAGPARRTNFVFITLTLSFPGAGAFIAAASRDRASFFFSFLFFLERELRYGGALYNWN